MIAPTVSTARALTEALAALMLAQQGAELLLLRESYSDEGVWPLALLKDDYRSFPALLRKLLGVLFAPRAFLLLIALRTLSGLFLPFTSHVGVPLFAVLASILICVRFRGVFNGGSDYMTVVVLTGLTVTRIGPTALVHAGVLYIAVQSLLSYFVAGVVKLKEPDWRHGRALPAFIAHPYYGAPPWLKALVARHTFALSLSWGVMLFEVAGPWLVAFPASALGFVIVAGSFHVGTALAFGLNRFLFAWAATYPAILWLSTLR